MNSTTSIPATLVPDLATKPITRHVATAARILLGLVFFVFGLNGFFNFIPPPPTPMPDRAMAFIGGLMGSGYMLALIGGTQVVVGALLLANRFVALALILIAPVIVNIVAFHVFLERSGLTIALVVLGLESYLLWTRRAAYRGLLAPRS